MVGLGLIGALTWSQPDRDLRGGQSGNPFQIGRYLYTTLDFDYIFIFTMIFTIRPAELAELSITAVILKKLSMNAFL